MTKSNKSDEPQSIPTTTNPEFGERPTQWVPTKHQRALLRAAGFPDRHIESVPMGPPKWRSMVDTVHDVLVMSEYGAMIGIIGPRGTGKTQAAVAWGSQALDYENHEDGVLYTRVQDMFLRVRRAFGKDATMSEEEARNIYTRPHLLVVDEIQERSRSDWEQLFFTNVLDHRYGRQKLTVMIGNLTCAVFMQQLGPSIISRLTETGRIFLADEWESFRDNPAPLFDTA